MRVYGPRQRRRRNRRIGKSAVLVILLFMLASMSSMTTWDKPAPEYSPSPSELARLRNLYMTMGGPYGEVNAYLEGHPEYARYITGEKEIPSGWHQTGQN